MRGLARLAWRSLTARRLRTSLTIAGVTLGVAVLVAALATNAGIAASAERTAANLVGRADLRVTAFGESGLGPETVAAIASTPGVVVAAPVLERRTFLGAASTSGGLPPAVTVLGIDPGADARLHDATVIAGTSLAGAGPKAAPGTGPDAAPGAASALITEHLATTDGYALGSTLTILGAGAPVRATVVGILAGDGPLGAGFGRTVIVSLADAQATFDEIGVRRVDVGLQPGTDPAAVIRAFEARLLAEPYVVTSSADVAASLRASTAEFAATTALIAAIALFAAAFLIFNTMSMTVAERTREVGLLRAVGANRGQVTRYMLWQALAIGAVGSLLGLGLGVLLARAIAASLGAVGTVPLDVPALPVDGAIVAVLVGLAVTVAAAIEPARRAARIPPVEALRPMVERRSTRGARIRWLIVVFVVVGVGGLVAWPRDAGAASATRAVAVYGTLLALTLLVPILVPALARLAGLPFRLPFRLDERLARATLVRDRGRAALTVGALGVGLAIVVALGAVGQNARAVAGAWVADVVPGDVLVTSIRPVGPGETVAADLEAVAGVRLVSPVATFDLAIGGIASDGAAMVGADLAADGRLTLTAGDRATAFAAIDAGGAAIVPRSLADRRDLAVGDRLTAAAIDGSIVALEIVGIAERTLPGRTGEAVIVGWSDASRHLGVVGADAFAIRFEPSEAGVAATALTTVAGLAALEVVPVDRIRGAIDDALLRVFGWFDALALIAVIVAALGIANTLSMNVMERVREIGILRAAGMTRHQVWRSVVVEAGVIGLAGAMVGIVGGLLTGALMVVLAGGRLTPEDLVPWSAVGVALTLGVVLAMLAAAYPARLAARLSIVRAVAYE